eukprot:954460-Alexandrium_andersonii.AAC.1
MVRFVCGKAEAIAAEWEFLLGPDSEEAWAHFRGLVNSSSALDRAACYAKAVAATLEMAAAGHAQFLWNRTA